MLTPCCPSAGPTGGAGVACPPGHWSLTFAVITFAIVVPLACGMRIADCGIIEKCCYSLIPQSAIRIPHSDSLDLPVFEVHRRGPVEDDEHDLDDAAGLDDLLDGPLEVLERAFLDLDAVAALDLD